jgi:hypothetical protein
MSLNNDRRVSVRINGVDEGVWDKRSGGKTDSAEKKYHPGGGRAVPPISLGGKQEHDNVTCGRWLDAPASKRRLKVWRRLCGKQTPVEVTELDTDPDGNVVGEGDTYIGTLKAAWPSDADSENDDTAMVEIEVTVTSVV